MATEEVNRGKPFVVHRCGICGSTTNRHATWCGDAEPAEPTEWSALDRALISALDPGQIKSDGGSSDYYKLPEGAEQIQDLVEFKNMNFSMGNIFKAAYRMGQKAGNDDLYDIRKIIWYANRELERLTKLKQEKA